MPVPPPKQPTPPPSWRVHKATSEETASEYVVRIPKARKIEFKAKLKWMSLLISSLIAGALVIGYLVLDFLGSIPDPKFTAAAPRPPGLVFVDVKGRQIARRGPIIAAELSIDDMPVHLIGAVLAVEDKRFFEHPGVDAAGLARAGFANVRAGKVVQGGSTITQQLAKNLFLDGRRTMKRKAQEAVLALWIEARFTKREILEMYLNRVYFGAGAWGVEAAAQRYFGRSATELGIAEAAVLAGLLKAPSRYNPTHGGEMAAERATWVLDRMVEIGYLSKAQRAAATHEAVRVKASAPASKAGHFIDWAFPQIREVRDAKGGDLVVRTTLDLDMQAAAEVAIRHMVHTYRDRNVTEGVLVALDGNGAVRAMVGGRSYVESQFNRAVQMRRQPGSAFKPFVYAAAFESGLRPNTIRIDQPITVEDWTPRNFTPEFRGPVRLRDAFVQSINTVAVQVAEEVGRGRVIGMAKRLGLRGDEMEPIPSTALGSHSVAPLDLFGAYAPFANGGYKVKPFAIQSVERPDGTVLWRAPRPRARIVLHAQPRRFINGLMADTVEFGTGSAARLPDRAAAGKTGTTNEYRDAWFVGFVPGFVVGVWAGNDDFDATDGVTGGLAPARAWRQFMGVALQDKPVRELDARRLGDMPLTIQEDPALPSDAEKPTGNSPGEPRGSDPLTELLDYLNANANTSPAPLEGPDPAPPPCGRGRCGQTHPPRYVRDSAPVPRPAPQPYDYGVETGGPYGDEGEGYGEGYDTLDRAVLDELVDEARRN